ncbi:MAG: hypothetical protein U5L96_02060 [Owenweeksia sp.]|nr:hypothetical protein [Owenweeksia sp.]
MFSFYHFKKENRQYHQHRLQRKKETITESIDYFLSKQPLGRETDSIVTMFSDKICELANINSMDINIYSLKGNLLISSNPNLFDAKILEEELATSIIRALQSGNHQVLVKSSTDSMQYMSTYDFIHNFQNKPIAIVNLPYFDSSDIHRQDINDFLMRLLLIYILLFLVSIMVAYLLSNYITGSLAAIGEKLKNVKINETNPPLQWKFDDEVGTLVDEYNRMLGELEKAPLSWLKQSAILPGKKWPSKWRMRLKTHLRPCDSTCSTCAKACQQTTPISWRILRKA